MLLLTVRAGAPVSPYDPRDMRIQDWVRQCVKNLKDKKNTGSLVRVAFM